MELKKQKKKQKKLLPSLSLPEEGKAWVFY